LKQYGVDGALEDPVLQLYSGQTVIETNDNWSSDAGKSDRIIQVSAQAGAPGLAVGSKDAAIVITLSPGGYTAQLSGACGSTGIGMIEIYEADSVVTDAKLINISTRSETRGDAEVQIAGFIISGNKSKNVLIRALGPQLAQSGVTNYLTDPVLTLYTGQTILQTDDDWSTGLPTPAAVGAATFAAHAIPLAGGSTDSAIVTTLAPGGYTAQVSGKNGQKGVTLSRYMSCLIMMRIKGGILIAACASYEASRYCLSG